jgi:hypothetical protein
MLHTITTSDDPLLIHIADDPVRPEIPREFRVERGRFVLALAETTEQPQAIVCVSLHNTVPTTVDELHATSESPTVAIFYTIWSYAPGAGRALLMSAVSSIRERHPTITRFVTLSPKTEMARKFHLKNGAIVLQENEQTTNYEYVIRVE